MHICNKKARVELLGSVISVWNYTMYVYMDFKRFSLPNSISGGVSILPIIPCVDGKRKNRISFSLFSDANHNFFTYIKFKI